VRVTKFSAGCCSVSGARPVPTAGSAAVIVERIVVLCVDYDVTMLRLHYYSNVVRLRLESIDEDDDEVYSLDQIKEFEAVSRAWKEALAEHLLQGTARLSHRTPVESTSGLLLSRRVCS
jgi:uncharacterized protein HemX